MTSRISRARTSGEPVAPIRALITLWRFSRPHTLIGTAISILGIYAIAAAELPGLALGDGLGDLTLTLVAGAAVNLYIVGLNQCEDVDIDRVNKPWLPIAAGRLSVAQGWAIVAVSGVLALGLAVTQGWVEVAGVSAAMAIGTAYSLRPLRLKRYPAFAAASISIVRACIVNLAVYEHFAASLGGRAEVSTPPATIVALTLFVLPFSLAIAVFKDVPDVEGDRRFRIATVTVLFGPRAAFRLGMAGLTAGYLGMAAFAPFALQSASAWVLVVGHLVLLAVLWSWTRNLDLDDAERFTPFYMRVWQLFFLEYALVPAALLAGS